MTTPGVLDYAAPAPAPSLYRWMRAALVPVAPGVSSVAAAGALSTAYMRALPGRHRPHRTDRAGRRLLPGVGGAGPDPARDDAVGDAVALDGMPLPARRPPRVAVLSVVPLAGLWCAAALWVARNGEIAFP